MLIDKYTKVHLIGALAVVNVVRLITNFPTFMFIDASLFPMIWDTYLCGRYLISYEFADQTKYASVFAASQIFVTVKRWKISETCLLSNK